MTIDFGRTADDYGRHRQGFPALFFQRLAEQGLTFDGRRVLDLGTGTGLLARDLARRGAHVTGLDPSAELLALAARQAADEGLACEFAQGTAEATGLPAASFELVTAGQCWHWFDAPAVCRELRRLLAPGGCFVSAHLDWLPLAGTVVAATEALILEHNPGWALAGGDGLHAGELDDLARGGLENLASAFFDLDLVYSHAAWRGRIRASAGVAASLTPDAVERFDAAHAALLAARFPEDPLAVPHRVFWVLAS